jgi:hypothetical protein
MTDPVQQAPARAEPGAYSANIYYYAENKADLLLDCVQPLTLELAPQLRHVYFLRHWLRGPHIKLCLAGDAATVRELIYPRVRAAAERYLAERPSRAVVDRARLLGLHQELALRERETGPLTPLAADNSVTIEALDRRLHVLGSEAAADLLAEFHHAATPLAFEALELVRRGKSLQSLAFDLLVATAHAEWPDIRRGFISYRSHAEGFIVQATDPAARRALCDGQYRAQADVLKQRLHRIVDAVERGQPALPVVSPWLALLRRFRARAAHAIATGEIGFSATAPRRGEGSTWGPELLQHSPFHRALQHNPGRLEFMREDLGFLGYRLMLNYLYLFLGRVGILPFERFLSCYLVAAAVEDLFDLSATDLVAS